MRSLGPRFALEAGFLVVVAVAAWLGRLGWVGIVLVMAGAWLAVAALEWTVSRGSARRVRAGEAPSEHVRVIRRSSRHRPEEPPPTGRTIRRSRREGPAPPTEAPTGGAADSPPEPVPAAEPSLAAVAPAPPEAEGPAPVAAG